MKTLFHKAKELDADALVILDSDGQHEANDIPSLLEPIMSGEADFAMVQDLLMVEWERYASIQKVRIKVITATNNLSSNSKSKTHNLVSEHFQNLPWKDLDSTLKEWN